MMPSWSGTVSFSEVNDPGSSGMRLDLYVAEVLGLLSRSQIKARGLEASVNAKPVKISRKLISGDRLNLIWKEAESSVLDPQDIPLSVLYEDDRVIVVDKPQGLVVHPGAGNRTGTLANALLFRRLHKGLPSEGFRPGIVHRLDKDTSGVIIAAWDDEALAFLADQFKSRTTRKTYIAIVKGLPPASTGTIETHMGRDPRDRKRFSVVSYGGKHAVTLYRVLRAYGGYALVLLRPKTGRTHQLRVHMRHIGCPILGDPVYSQKDRRFPDATLMLHAWSLSLVLPPSRCGEAPSRPARFRSPLPARFRRILKALHPV